MSPRASRAKSTLFVSCDLVGSTHFKQTRSGWQKVFLSFYHEFTQFVEQANREIHNDSTTEFELWKSVGDELIFEVEVKSEKEISRAVRVWLHAMKAYEEQVLSDWNLSLKGGAFVATFPGPDSESTIPRTLVEEDSDEPVVLLNQKALAGNRKYTKYLYDYFGPSIDTGFRLFGLSSRRHFILSVEVAWAVAIAAHDAAGARRDEDLHRVDDFILHGSHALKGVWNGREYPAFAIDRECLDAVNTAMAQLNGGTLLTSQIIGVCHACHESTNWQFRLYLPDSSNVMFRTEPPNAMAELIEQETPLDGAETNLDDAETVPSPDGENLEPEPPLGEFLSSLPE